MIAQNAEDDMGNIVQGNVIRKKADGQSIEVSTIIDLNVFLFMID